MLTIKRYPFGPPRPATEADLKARWGGGKPGERFRCYFCGHRFAVGEDWRAVYAGSRGLINFLVGACCDTLNDEEMLAKWVKANEEAATRFWWLRDHADDPR